MLGNSLHRILIPLINLANNFINYSILYPVKLHGFSSLQIFYFGDRNGTHHTEMSGFTVPLC